ADSAARSAKTRQKYLGSSFLHTRRRCPRAPPGVGRKPSIIGILATRSRAAPAPDSGARRLGARPHRTMITLYGIVRVIKFLAVLTYAGAGAAGLVASDRAMQKRAVHR